MSFKTVLNRTANSVFRTFFRSRPQSSSVPPNSATKLFIHKPVSSDCSRQSLFLRRSRRYPNTNARYSDTLWVVECQQGTSPQSDPFGGGVGAGGHVENGMGYGVVCGPTPRIFPVAGASVAGVGTSDHVEEGMDHGVVCRPMSKILAVTGAHIAASAMARTGADQARCGCLKVVIVSLLGQWERADDALRSFCAQCMLPNRCPDQDGIRHAQQRTRQYLPIDRDILRVDWPPSRDKPLFCAELGKTVAAFRYLENELGSAC